MKDLNIKTKEITSNIIQSLAKLLTSKIKANNVQIKKKNQTKWRSKKMQTKQ